ncbi:GNAT family N-acetyltransferase [Microbacterium sp. zg.Y1090]|uniref:GNAT family N-acetyltransferase n=1 Tax=Microbacterium TaxID=33882 RepID=UPI00214B2929|nr:MULTISPECIES: GNAT family protein [unclassified Microbacterium]MCR2813842.1 GNAT family N-acetyltransferase [Microbacterium sp. zg.Y1084]MCR2819644.1 GNAT family N-acetyltransferase [Microbacterium sp. zg.Y1090]MDL5487492.1 GNAT family protein [Microbacterium sp. zg-Y1211]WIM28111.1 GNAT family protein [Microbacterium sp. zg-Y1090]
MALLLRPWTGEDAAALARAAHRDPDLSIQFNGGDLSDPAAAASFIEANLRFDERTKNWALVDDGVAVGNVGASGIEFRHGTAWISYWLAAPARGKGYATSALLAVCDWAFGQGVHRLELGHRVNNPASCRVATAAGFRAEGIEREKLRYGDERFDVETHARLATDPQVVAQPSSPPVTLFSTAEDALTGLG